MKKIMNPGVVGKGRSALSCSGKAESFRKQGSNEMDLPEKEGKTVVGGGRAQTVRMVTTIA